MISIFAVAFCALSKLHTQPFRLALEDTKGMNPHIFRSYDNLVEVQQFRHPNTHYTSTQSGHILVLHPLTNCNEGIRTPLSVFSKNKNDGEFCLVDAFHLFESQVPCFTCFVTGRVSSQALAMRIEDTCIWLLVSTCFDLVTCNECVTRINRREFKEIQCGFLKLLLQSTK